MFLKIYGKKGCPFCVKAKKLADQLKSFREDFDFEYIDFEEIGLTKESLGEKINVTVETVPQILLDDKVIGGFTEFEAYVRKERLFSKF
jgi:glutaredoxin 1